MRKPKHLAIIMDGNGRWAQERGHNRVFGHIRGARVAKDIIEECARQRVSHLTLFTFSTENWLRPRQEVQFLMKLLIKRLRQERKNLVENNIQFSTIGDLEGLPSSVQAAVAETKEKTQNCTGMRLVFALNYGGRQDMRQAVRKVAENVKNGFLEPEDINDAVIGRFLESNQLPDPDLIVRTSGEHRLSNFFLWQAAYSEFYFTDTYWPDFNESELEKAFQFFGQSERRFGRTSAQLKSSESAPVTAKKKPHTSKFQAHSLDSSLS